ncbi:MAG: triphosphoribosyl-dephospho-CoA synthase CitG [Tissierella sp.]|uniref:triphosphoribosyl-dephospho-CoA synthase CitG n=1 Tax=Tissierella sp. TaxID=41274 RepID=UPI003F9B13DC
MDELKFCEKISNIAIKSILYEVSATPKPGLVDRKNDGAHKDMNFFTFLSSASVLSSYFYNCTYSGIIFKGEDYRQLLKEIRPIGRRAEKDMFHSTGGVNTHKGIIFSGGIIAAASGSIYKENKELNLKELIKRVKDISQGIARELEGVEGRESLTYGEKLFIKHGSKGIRGEVEGGFETIINYSYPIFQKLIEKNSYNINDILIQTLLNLMVYTEDSNILGRHSIEDLDFAKKGARQALKLGGIFTKEGKEYVESLDKIFIEKNISPGGSADLLAITFMFYMIENGDIIW